MVQRENVCFRVGPFLPADSVQAEEAAGGQVLALLMQGFSPQHQLNNTADSLPPIFVALASHNAYLRIL